MESRNCPKCKKLFYFIKSPICPECMVIEEEKFEEVKKYIRSNPNNNIKEIEKQTGVSAGKILAYLKEGRLTISDGLKGELRCEKCNKPIARGRFCEACSTEMQIEFRNLTDLKMKSNSSKMYTANIRKN